MSDKTYKIEHEFACGCEAELEIILDADGKVEELEVIGEKLTFCSEHGYPEADDEPDGTATANLDNLIEGRHRLTCQNYHPYGDYSPLAKAGPREPCDCFTVQAADALAALGVAV